MSLPYPHLQHGQLEQYYMSRHGTPASDFGRLALGGSSTSSSGDMPVTTRAMRRGQGNGSSSHQSSSRAGAASAGQSSRTARGAQASGRRNVRAEREEESSESSDESEEDDGNAFLIQKTTAVYEIQAACDPNCRTPQEIREANAQTNVQRRVGAAIIAVTKTQAELDILRRSLPRADCLSMIEQNLLRRMTLIDAKLKQNIAVPAQGEDVPSTFRAFRALFSVTEPHIGAYAAAMNDRGSRLTELLFSILTYLARDDRDVYADSQVPRAQYVGGGNTGNLFRQFVAEHRSFIEGLQRLNAGLLREQMRRLQDISGYVGNHGPSNGDRAQWDNLRRALNEIWQRMRQE